MIERLRRSTFARSVAQVLQRSEAGRPVLHVLKKLMRSSAAGPLTAITHEGLPADKAPSTAVLEVRPPSDELLARIATNNHMTRYASKRRSQGGEEGILDEVFVRLGIKDGWCVEFGACDGLRDCNTSDLVRNKGWKAVYIESDPTWFSALRGNYADRPDVYCFQKLIGWQGPDTLDNILATTPIPEHFQLLIVDIDGNDYHVWEALRRYTPRVVMIEFNAFIPPDVDFVQEARPELNRSASLAAVARLGKTKGYELICTINGNAMFVRSEDFPLFEVPDNRPAMMHIPPAETKVFQGYDGSIFLAGLKQLIWKFQRNRDGEIDHIYMTDADVQVLPEALRVFRPRMSYSNRTLETYASSGNDKGLAGNVLAQYRRNVSSECGEDGVLRRIFDLLGVDSGYCVDVGAYDGKTFSNTWALINQAGWAGLQIEADPVAAEKIEKLYEERPDVRVLCAQVDLDGAASLDSALKSHAVRPDFELLSIDIEGCDYHLWASLTSFTPKVVLIDFNPSIPNDIVFIQASSALVNHGSSLRAFVELAKKKGYQLAATTPWNAAFVRSDVFPRLGVLDNSIDNMYRPPFEMKLFQAMDGTLFLRGCRMLVRQEYQIEHEDLQILPPRLRGVRVGHDAFGKKPSVFYA